MLESPERPSTVSNFRNEAAREQLAICVRWVAAVVVIISAAVGLAAMLLPDKSLLYKENSILENASIVVWGLSTMFALLMSIAPVTKADRSLGVWLLVLSVLAALRELDAQILLNPKTLGEYGVRYKISWWLDGSVPVFLKLGWGLLFLAIAFLLLWPVFRARSEIKRMVLAFDLRVLLFAAALVFLAMGFAVDDLMRGSKLASLETRQTVEETSEMIGATVFLLTVLAHRRTALATAKTRPAA